MSRLLKLNGGAILGISSMLLQGFGLVAMIGLIGPPDTVGGCGFMFAFVPGVLMAPVAVGWQ